MYDNLKKIANGDTTSYTVLLSLNASLFIQKCKTHSRFLHAVNTFQFLPLRSRHFFWQHLDWSCDPALSNQINSYFICRIHSMTRSEMLFMTTPICKRESKKIKPIVLHTSTASWFWWACIHRGKTVSCGCTDMVRAEHYLIVSVLPSFPK